MKIIKFIKKIPRFHEGFQLISSVKARRYANDSLKKFISGETT